MKPSDLPKGAILCYYRDKKGLRGVIVALAAGILGWSLCNKKDQFDKCFGVKIAFNRAKSFKELSEKFPDKVDQILSKVYSRVPQTLGKTFAEAMERSNKYYRR